MGNVLTWASGGNFSPGEQIWKACKNGNAELLRMFRTKLTDENRHYIEYRDKETGRTPLMMASANGKDNCVEILLQVGALINAKDTGRDGNTALHYACLNGHSRVVQILLNNTECNPYMWNMRGCSALDSGRSRYGLFSESNVLQCIQILEERFKVYKGWLFYCSENLVSRAAGLSSLNSWNKRFCLVLRTGNPNFLELALFKSPSGEYRTACPTIVVWYRVSDGATPVKDVKWFNGKSYAFEVKGVKKNENCSAVLSSNQVFQFAATDDHDYSQWLTFLTTNAQTAVYDPSLNFESNRTNPNTRSNRGNVSTLEQRERLYAAAASLQAHNGDVDDAISPPPIPSVQNEPSILESSTTNGRMNENSQEIKSLSQLERKSFSSNVSTAPSSSTSTTTVSEPSSNDSNIEGECVICMENKPNGVCVPCGHNAACMNCLESVQESTGLCPVCRLEIREAIRLFKV